MTQADISNNLRAFWIDGSLYAATDPVQALNLANKSDRSVVNVLSDVKPAIPEDLAEAVPWGDQYVTLGELLTRTEAGCLVQRRRFSR